ncbi:hypothetical protein HMI55_002095 [Coelomomyces lativittatus]|nr:hypothetical protein HMI55_002095 [Coelomomyces lativittatus]
MAQGILSPPMMQGGSNNFYSPPGRGELPKFESRSSFDDNFLKGFGGDQMTENSPLNGGRLSVQGDPHGPYDKVVRNGNNIAGVRSDGNGFKSVCIF